MAVVVMARILARVLTPGKTTLYSTPGSWLELKIEDSMTTDKRTATGLAPEALITPPSGYEWTGESRTPDEGEHFASWDSTRGRQEAIKCTGVHWSGKYAILRKNGPPLEPGVYRKKDAVVEAMQYDGTDKSRGDIRAWTAQRALVASTGEWVVRDGTGSFHIVPPGEFADRYEQEHTT